MKIGALRHDQLGKVKILLDEIDSTQVFASQLLKDSQVDQGTLILARNQTHGQGRLGKTWSSQVAENFIGSLILKHEWKIPPPPFSLSKVAALAVHDTLEAITNQSCEIKWPNDLIINHKKISGILLSNQWKGSWWESTIIGIGINVNQTLFDASLSQASSIYQVMNKRSDMNEVVNQLVHYFNLYYHHLIKGKLDLIDAIYHHALYGTQYPVQFKIHETGQIMEAIIQEVNSSGKLKASLNDRDWQEFDLEQISILLP